jgi:hypothetical protein
LTETSSTQDAGTSTSPNRVLLSGFLDYVVANGYLQQQTGKTFSDCTPEIYGKWKSYVSPKAAKKHFLL